MKSFYKSFQEKWTTTFYNSLSRSTLVATLILTASLAATAAQDTEEVIVVRRKTEIIENSSQYHRMNKKLSVVAEWTGINAAPSAGSGGITF